MPGAPAPRDGASPQTDPLRHPSGWPFGVWVIVGLGLGLLLPVAALFGTVWLRTDRPDLFAALDPLGAGLAAFAAVALAGIVCMISSRARGLGTGLLISVAATPLVLLGVCVALVKGAG